MAQLSIRDNDELGPLDRGHDDLGPRDDYTGSEEEDEASEGEDGIDFEEFVKGILKDLKDGHLGDLGDQAKRKQFTEVNYHILGEHNEDQKNMLHILAAEKDAKTLPAWELLEPLIEMLVQFQSPKKGIPLMVSE